MYWFTREKSKGSGTAPTHMANSQVLASISLQKEKEAENENRFRN
jgi:hypothetical protein